LFFVVVFVVIVVVVFVAFFICQCVCLSDFSSARLYLLVVLSILPHI
jgi:hypothetical protein